MCHVSFACVGFQTLRKLLGSEEKEE